MAKLPSPPPGTSADLTSPINPAFVTPTALALPRQGVASSNALGIDAARHATGGGLSPAAGETPACVIMRRSGRKG
jgi:hypothetical protein